MKWSFPDGATPLDPQETIGLRRKDLKTQAELFLAEAESVMEAELWLFGQVRGRPLDLEFLKTLHHKMFGQVWSWAGKFRTTQRSIGIDPLQIQGSLLELIGTIQYQQSMELPSAEIAARYHHQLLYIHPFSSGNGRWARRVTELHAESLALMPPSWVELAAAETTGFRAQYIAALKRGDQGDLAPLRDLLFPAR